MKKIMIMLAATVAMMVGLAAPASAAAKCHDATYNVIVHHPAVTHVVHHDAVTEIQTVTVIDEPAYDETVIDVPAYDETIVDADAIPAQHYSYVGGDLDKNATPPTPAENPDVWQANAKKEPHLNNKNITWVDEFGVGLHYASHKSSGKNDWFYFQPFVPEQSHVVHHDAVTHVVHHDAVTHEEEQEVVVQEAYDETVVDSPAYVTSKTVHVKVCKPTDKPDTNVTVTQKHVETPAPVPTVIESGLAGTQTAPEDENNAGWFVALAVGILLLGAAALRRKN